MVRRRLLPSLLALVSFNLSTARAHEPPRGKALLWLDESSSAFPLVLTNRGVLFHETGEASSAIYSLRCNEAYDVGATQVPFMAYDRERGRFVSSTSDRILQSDDGLCSFRSRLELSDMGRLGGVFGGIAQSQAAPDHLLATTIIESNVSGLWQSSDFGDSWQKIWTFDAGESLNVLLASPNDPSRFYASGLMFDLETFEFSYNWYASTDAGESWSRVPTASELRPLFVHPSNPDTVFATERADQQSDTVRLLRSEDAGQTFEAVGEFEAIRSVTSTSDASRIWLGGADGLYVSDDEGVSFEKLETSLSAVDCLAYRGDTLWLCAVSDPGAPHPVVEGVFSWPPEASEPQVELRFDQVRMNRDCGESDRVCHVPWVDWQLEILPDTAQPDAGSDAGPDAGAGEQDGGLGDAGADGGPDAPASNRQSNSGCSASGAGSNGAGIAWILVSAALSLWGARRSVRVVRRR